MEKKSTIYALGTSSDWLLLKLYCKSHNINPILHLFFSDDWESLQKSHLNHFSPSLTFLFYHNSLCHTSFSTLLPAFTPFPLTKPAAKSFLKKHLHKKYIEWQISFNSSTYPIVLELNFLSCPRTCENFWQICTNHFQLSYVNSKIHRSVKSCYIEGGIIDSKLKSIYIDYFPDENFNYRHDTAGVIGMVKSSCGQNGARFYITLRPIEYFDGKLVAFGRVVEGMAVIRKIAELETSNQILTTDVTITSSKEFLSADKRPEAEKSCTGFRDLANEMLKFL